MIETGYLSMFWLPLILYTMIPYLAKGLGRFQSKQLFLGGILGFYCLTFAFCLARYGWPDAIHMFKTYSLTLFGTLIALSCGGFFVFTVWLHSSRGVAPSEENRPVPGRGKPEGN